MALFGGAKQNRPQNGKLGCFVNLHRAVLTVVQVEPNKPANRTKRMGNTCDLGK